VEVLLQLQAQVDPQAAQVSAVSRVADRHSLSPVVDLEAGLAALGISLPIRKRFSSKFRPVLNLFTICMLRITTGKCLAVAVSSVAVVLEICSLALRVVQPLTRTTI
jgi:hypothetical protein